MDHFYKRPLPEPGEKWRGTECTKAIEIMTSGATGA